MLVRRSGNVNAAEDALADAFAAALATWPTGGVPDAPEAWLLTAGRRALVRDRRHQGVRERAAPALAQLIEERVEAESPALGDERLALLMACAHPDIDRAVQPALMLQVVLGLDAARIASAFLLSPSAVGQRLVRAKRSIRARAIPFAVPDVAEVGPRLSSVLDAIYAAFGTGWDEAGGGLADEAIWLARLVVQLAPDRPEPKSLLALMLYADSRRDARRAGGAFVPLSQQDTRLWDVAAIAEAERLLREAATNSRGADRFGVEAAIQSLHIETRRTGRSQPAALLRLYDLLVQIAPAVGAATARAAAYAEAGAPAEALHQLDAIGHGGQYASWWATRARVLQLLGDNDGVAAALRMSAGLSTDPAVRAFLLAGVE